MAAAAGGCGQPDAAREAAAERWYDADQIARGGALYLRHCARCHGRAGQGGDRWPAPSGDPRRAAPPLDGSGHSWYHPLPHLERVVLDGGVSPRTAMAGWRGKLTLSEVRAIIAWFQSLWPESVYRNWERIQQRSEQAPGADGAGSAG